MLSLSSLLDVITNEQHRRNLETKVLKTPIIIVHFQIATEQKLKLGQVGVAHNDSFSLQ